MRLKSTLLMLAVSSSVAAEAINHYIVERNYFNPDEAVTFALEQYPDARPVGLDDRGAFYEVRLIWNGQLIVVKVNKK